jgi:hypothetical protein
MRTAGCAPEACLQDLARAAVQPCDALLAFNPFLSPQSCNHLQEGVWVINVHNLL